MSYSITSNNNMRQLTIRLFLLLQSILKSWLWNESRLRLQAVGGGGNVTQRSLSPHPSFPHAWFGSHCPGYKLMIVFTGRMVIFHLRDTAVIWRGRDWFSLIGMFFFLECRSSERLMSDILSFYLYQTARSSQRPIFSRLSPPFLVKFVAVASVQGFSMMI